MANTRIPAAGAELEGELIVPVGARAAVLFAHGSGSSRHSPRNMMVASHLRQGRLGTLLLDLLTPSENEIDLRTSHFRFDIPMLAQRLIAATDWIRQNAETSHLRLGYFGASTGAAAALIAAAERSAEVQAVVSRGGRPDLAGDALLRIQQPTLLLVGSLDPVVARLNRAAFEKLPSEKWLEIIPGATHLFEEAGALERVAELAREWFQLHLIGRTTLSARQ